MDRFKDFFLRQWLSKNEQHIAALGDEYTVDVGLFCRRSDVWNSRLTVWCQDRISVVTLSSDSTIVENEGYNLKTELFDSYLISPLSTVETLIDSALYKSTIDSDTWYKIEHKTCRKMVGNFRNLNPLE